MPKWADRWLDEGWSPWRIGVGTASFVALVVTITGYATHPHHPGAVWWAFAAVAVIAVWALLEMIRWHIRHNRIQRELKKCEGDLAAARSASRPTFPAVSGKPLERRYRQREPYCRQDPSGYQFVYQVGIGNPADNPPATGVRLEWTEMSVRPPVIGGYPSVVPPQPVPRATGGDPAIGITMPPGREELWVVASAVLDGAGNLSVGAFSPAAMGGRWRGYQWRFPPGDRWRFTYRIVADNLPSTTFSIVMTVLGGRIRCDLED